MISRSGGRSAAVALPAEGVDRNFWMGVKPSSRLVVLLAEGVDRNDTAGLVKANELLSPSSRRAWIEIEESRWWALKFCCRPPRGGRG